MTAGAGEGGFRSAKRFVPVPVKRAARRVIPARYHHYFDPDWHRRTIGNVPYWEELGRNQFDYLVERGLEPGHSLLDVGCGPLRAGIHFIRYLEPGRYVGVDKRADVLEETRRRELSADDLAKEPLLVAMDDFDFPSLGRMFDYALAQSVFTHLPLNSIIRCVMNVEKVLVPGGRFFATIWENPEGKRNLGDIRQSETAVTHFDRDFYHYDVATFEWICEGTSLAVERLGDWGHPRNQKMLVITRGSAPDAA